MFEVWYNGTDTFKEAEFNTYEEAENYIKNQDEEFENYIIEKN